MTYEQYWNGDVWMVEAFRESDKLRQKRNNELAWLQGAYILRAIDATVGNMARKRGEQPSQYPDAPLPIGDERESRSEDDEKAKEDRELAIARLYMNNMVRFGKGWGKSQGGR